MKRLRVDMPVLLLLVAVIFVVGLLLGRCNRRDRFRVVRDASTDSTFNRLHPRAYSPDTIHVDSRWWRNNPIGHSTRPGRDTFARTGLYPVKFQTDTLINLNTADTLTLQRIPGIGRGFSHMIVRRRELLGGFVSVAQLLELNHFPESALAWFTLDSLPAPRRLDINHADFSTLLRHPYLNYAQVQAICRYRERIGYITSLDDLSNDTAFTTADLRRLAPYVSLMSTAASRPDTITLQPQQP